MNKYKWKRYRFKTRAVDDYRPLIFNEKYPWWCTGFNDDCAVIIAYLPCGEDLYKYWDDAFNIDHTLHNEIEFSSRFPKPNYFIKS